MFIEYRKYNIFFNREFILERVKKVSWFTRFFKDGNKKFNRNKRNIRIFKRICLEPNTILLREF
jgi:hypothetical protein